MTEGQLRQKLVRDDLSPEEIEDYLSERAEAQIDDWRDSQEVEPIYAR